MVLCPCCTLEYCRMSMTDLHNIIRISWDNESRLRARLAEAEARVERKDRIIDRLRRAVVVKHRWSMEDRWHRRYQAAKRALRGR